MAELARRVGVGLAARGSISDVVDWADRARAAVDRFRNGLGICLLEMGERDAGEASLREAMRGAPHMAGQAITTLAAASHGRFFLRPSAASKFLRVEKT